MKQYLIGFIAGVLVTWSAFQLLERGQSPKPIQAEEEPLATTEEGNHLPPDSITFYDQFHEDSPYHLQHLSFPLSAIPPNIDSTFSGNYFWQENDWQLHRPFDAMDGEFVQHFQSLGGELIIEEIQHQSGQYGMQRRFARLSNGWNLIFYAAMNQLSQEAVSYTHLTLPTICSV